MPIGKLAAKPRLKSSSVVTSKGPTPEERWAHVKPRASDPWLREEKGSWEYTLAALALIAFFAALALGFVYLILKLIGA